MELTVEGAKSAAKNLKYTLVISDDTAYKYTLYYGSGKKKVVAFVTNAIEPLFERLESIEKVRYLQGLSTIQLLRLLCLIISKKNTNELRLVRWWLLFRGGI